MLEITVIITTSDEPALLDIAMQAAEKVGLKPRRGYQQVIVQLEETHELADVANLIHTAALKEGK